MTTSAEDATPRPPRPVARAVGGVARAARAFGGACARRAFSRTLGAARAVGGAMGLRTRLMLLGVAGLSAGLALGGVTLVAVTGIALRNTVDTQARQTAEAVARLIDEQGEVPDAVPVIGVNGVNGLDVVVQVVDAQGRVRSASIGADRLTPLLHSDELARTEAGEAMSVDGGRIGIAGPVRVVTARAGPADDRLTVLVGKSMSGTNASVRLLGTVVLVGFPLLVLILAVAAWRVTGAALRPVEALRQGAEEITGGARPGQLPVPASKDEIHRLAVTLNGMLDRLEAVRARQRSFVADAAHELRSPLTNMRTQLEVGRRLGKRTDWPAVADDLLADAERLSRLVDDLLLLARADDPAATQAARNAAEPVELRQLATDVARRYPGVRTDGAAPDEPADAAAPGEPAGATGPGRERWTLGEPDALARVVGNLVDNAVRHARGDVVVSVAGDGAYQIVAVTDDGPGIPPKDRDRVFDRFTRLDDARDRDGGGAGLGLAIVRELVRRHGGTVTLTDAGGGTGLRAEVRLPAYRPQPRGAPGG